MILHDNIIIEKMVTTMDDDGRLGDFIEGEQSRTRNIDNRLAPAQIRIMKDKIKMLEINLNFASGPNRVDRKVLTPF